MKGRNGFVLVELLVAIGIFLTVVSIGVGGFARALRTIRQNANFVSASGNVSLALEQMAREMRTGYDFCAGSTCPPLAEAISQIVFKNTKGDVVTYYAEDGVIKRDCSGTCNGEPGVQSLTATTVVIEHLGFKVFGVAPEGDGYQPRITITVGVSTKDPGTSSTVMTLQTTVSSRFPLDT